MSMEFEVGQQSQELGRKAGHKGGESKGKLKLMRTNWNPRGQKGLHEDRLILFQSFTDGSLCSTSDLQKGLTPLATYYYIDST